MNSNSVMALVIVVAVVGIAMALFMNDNAVASLVSFTTIDAPDGSDPEATAGDTLVFVAGTGITIEGDWATDTLTFTASATAATALALDLGDDDVNESGSLAEIAITGDSNSIFTEPAPDKLLIAAANNWPTADTADALSANGGNCTSGNAPLGVDTLGAVEGCFDVEEETHATEHASGGADLLQTERHAVWAQPHDVSTTMAFEELRLYADASGTIQDARCSVATAPTTGSVTVDFNLNGVTIFTTQSNRPTIAQGTNTDVSGAPDITAYSSGDYFDIDVDVVDAGDTAHDLTCQMRTREAVR